MRKMIDISHHNTIMDWDELKKACDVLCVRMGYGKNGIDRKYKEHMIGAWLEEIPMGIYIYSYAENGEDAKTEVWRLLDQAVDSKHIKFIAFDREEKRTSIGLNTEVVKAVLEEYQKAKTAIPLLLYMDQNYFQSFSIPFRSEIEEVCYKWIARYNTIPPETLCDAWQFTSKLSIKNNGGVFDCSYLTKAMYERITLFTNVTSDYISLQSKEIVEE